MKLYKYPRTFHVSWSPGATSDDKRIKDIANFEGKHVVVTEKFDGENTTMTQNRIYARSPNSRDHPSRHWVKGFWNQVRYIIPTGCRICGENMYARHSIIYKDLPSYFLGFSFWDENNMCVSWDETLSMFTYLDIKHVKILYSGIFDEDIIKNLYSKDRHMEGYVVRVSDSFSYDNFNKNVAKFVRKNHVQTDEHWMYKDVIPNDLA